MSKANTCIRVFADENQIKACKVELIKVQEPIAQLSKILKLSGNEVRLRILFLLHKESEMCPCDLSDVLDISVSAVSQHLRKLKDGNLVRDKKIGQTIFYSIIKERSEILMPILERLSKHTMIDVEN